MKKIYIISFFCVFLGANDQEELIMDIEKSLMATCCWSGTVYDHGNPDMEVEIVALVKAGKTKTEVLDRFVNQYGERVLAIPVAAGFNLFVWLAQRIRHDLNTLIFRTVTRLSGNCKNWINLSVDCIDAKIELYTGF